MPPSVITLPEAVEDLYDIAVRQGKTTSPKRLEKLGLFCIQELERRGLSGAELEASIAGLLRAKNWDVGWQHGSKYRLAISLKSLLGNLAGTVPNRGDDLMGEIANLQLRSPEIVTGYLMLFDVGPDIYSAKHESTWCELLESRLHKITGRRAPSWGFGMVEAALLLRVDFSAGPVLVTPAEEVEIFFDTLVDEIKFRNPGATSSA